jgi:hypothetical protein
MFYCYFLEPEPTTTTSTTTTPTTTTPTTTTPTTTTPTTTTPTTTTPTTTTTTPESLQCGINEEETCVFSCPPEKTCKNRYLHFRCARQGKKCQQKCICKPGYFRNPLGECITGVQCGKFNSIFYYFPTYHTTHALPPKG